MTRPARSAVVMTRPARSAVVGVVVAVLGGAIIDTRAFEADTTPPRVAMAYAVAVSMVAIGGWWWWQRKAWRAATSTRDASVQAVVLAAVTALVVRLAEWQWPVTRAESAGDASAAAASVWGALLLSCVVRPLAEEALLRGYLVRHLRAAGSERETLIVSALVSAGIAGSIVHAPSNVTLAVLLTLVVLRTQRLWLAASAHILVAVFDATMLHWKADFLRLPATPAVIVLLIIATGSVITLVRLLRETQWVQPPHSYRGVAPPTTWHLDLPN